MIHSFILARKPEILYRNHAPSLLIFRTQQSFLLYIPAKSAIDAVEIHVLDVPIRLRHVEKYYNEI